MKFDNYTIRILELDDLEAYFDLVQKNRKRLEDFFAGTVSRTATLNDTKDFLNEIVQLIKDKKYFPYIIIDDSCDQIIGFLDLKNIDWNIPKSEMGCYIDEDYANKGITTRAFELFCTYSFKHFKFKKLYLRTHVSNLAAQSVAEKCGFEKEGIIRRDYRTTSGQLIDLMYYGRLD